MEKIKGYYGNQEDYFFEDYTDACTAIWEGYKLYSQGAAVMRVGYWYIGSAKNLAKWNLNLRRLFRFRGESILEHQAKVAWLASAFMSNFPYYFGNGVEELDSTKMFRLYVISLTHDTGETKRGDIADDGGKKHSSKLRDLIELLVFKQLARAYGSDWQSKLVRSFELFQDQGAGSRQIQALYALDKIEAVLTNLVQESIKNPGRLHRKRRKITDQDRKYKRITGSDYAADIWGYGVKERIDNFPPEIKGPAYTLLDIAALDVRGEKFTWL